MHPTDDSNLPVTMDESWKLDHVGFVAKSIEEVGDRFAKSIGTTCSHEIIHGPLQVVNVSFIRGSNPLGGAVELVEPAGENSPVLRFLQQGGGFHLYYDVEQLEEQLRLNRSIGGVIVRSPLPAVAFEGQRIAWVVTKDTILLEFLEAAK